MVNIPSSSGNLSRFFVLFSKGVVVVVVVVLVCAFGRTCMIFFGGLSVPSAFYFLFLLPTARK